MKKWLVTKWGKWTWWEEKEEISHTLGTFASSELRCVTKAHKASKRSLQRAPTMLALSSGGPPAS